MSATTTMPAIDELLRRLVNDTMLRESRRAQRSVHRLLRRARGPLPVYYHPAFRLPVPSFEAASGGEPRRADFVAWFLADTGLLRADEFRAPARIRYSDLARVHTAALLDATNDPEVLARVFASSAAEIHVDELMTSVRYICGATMAAAREALERKGAVLSLAGGFHHAEPDKAAGYCPVNDTAVAIAALRAEGFTDRVVVLDLDAHPPDGTAACLRDDASVWIGSISGSDWGPLARDVDETVLPNADDRVYLRALDALLGRMPDASLAFVLAGGDVLAGDKHGALELTLDGTRARDQRVRDALAATPSVWLAAGGYSRDAWRVLAGTALVLARSPVPHVPRRYDPLDRRFSFVARSLRREDLSDQDDEIDLRDVAEDLRLVPRRRALLLGFYTAEGVELALERYGILEQIRRLGYEDPHIELSSLDGSDRVQLWARCEGAELLLIELVVEKRMIDGLPVLYVHWLTMRNLRAHFDEARPRLPGQEAPGLGLSREVSVILGRMAERLGLAGVAFTPGHLHVAYVARAHARFLSPERQGRFLALLRDLSSLPLLEATCAVAEGRVRLHGEPYAWEPTDMVYWLAPHPFDDARAAQERDRAHFTVEPRRPHSAIAPS